MVRIRTSVSGSDFEDLPRRFEAIQLRHAHIHHHHIGMGFLREPHRAAAVAGFADNLPASFPSSSAASPRRTTS